MRAILIPGMLVGVLAGWAFQRVSRTWKDWRRAVACAQALRRVYWRHAFQGLLWAVVLVLVWWVL